MSEEYIKLSDISSALDELDLAWVKFNSYEENRDLPLTSYKLKKFERSNADTSINQRPLVMPQDEIKKGEVIADGMATKNRELALGRNLLIAFVPWRGFNFEDAIVINERLVKQDALTSVHIEKFELEARETRLGNEEVTRDIPNVSERQLCNLDENGIVRVGTYVQPGDVLVGKVSPKSKTELTPEEKLLHAIFGRAGEDVKNDSLEVPPGVEGFVIGAQKFARRSHLSEEERQRDKAEVEAIEKGFRTQLLDGTEQLLGELWLSVVEGFQAGLLEVLASGDGLATAVEAALFMPRWTRDHRLEARLLLLHDRRDFVKGAWPENMVERAEALGPQLVGGVADFAKRLYGEPSGDDLLRVNFAILSAPYGAVRPYVQEDVPLPAIIDDLIRTTCRAVLKPRRSG